MKVLCDRHALSLNIEINFGSSEGMFKLSSGWKNVLCAVQEHELCAMVNGNA
jgi:hypothetical protein